MLYNRGIKEIDFKKYKRFFAFGCSFTNYKWPTWADIIGQEIKNYYNYGVSGAGNYYIFHCVMTADKLYKFTKDDLVMVKWTNAHREDRFIEDSINPATNILWSNQWLTPGNIYSQGVYSKEFMNYYSDTHCIMRDLALIETLRVYLESKNLDFDFLSMVPVVASLDGTTGSLTNTAKNAIQAYSDLIKKMPPSIFELIFNHNWHSISPRANYWTQWNPNYTDNHAHPMEHIEYIKKLYPDTMFAERTFAYTKYWHSVILNKHDAYTKPLFNRPMVKHFHSYRENLDYENNSC